MAFKSPYIILTRKWLEMVIISGSSSGTNTGTRPKALLTKEYLIVCFYVFNPPPIHQYYACTCYVFDALLDFKLEVKTIYAIVGKAV